MIGRPQKQGKKAEGAKQFFLAGGDALSRCAALLFRKKNSRRFFSFFLSSETFFFIWICGDGQKSTDARAPTNLLRAGRDALADRGLGGRDLVEGL